MSENTTKVTERDTQNKLIDLGMPTNLLGFEYLTRAIMLASDNPTYIHQVTKMLYPKIAKSTNTTPSRVERAIRHAIDVTCSRCDIEVLKNTFGYTKSGYNGKPTNSEFISMLVVRLKQEHTSAQE